MINDARIPSQTRPIVGISKYSGSKPVTDTIDYNRRYFMVRKVILTIPYLKSCDHINAIIYNFLFVWSSILKRNTNSDSALGGMQPRNWPVPISKTQQSSTGVISNPQSDIQHSSYQNQAVKLEKVRISINLLHFIIII